MFQNGKKTILKNSIRKINATKEREREKSKFESPCRSRWRRHMLVLTLIARTTLLSPSAAHRQPPRPISFSTPAYRFPFHAAPCRFLPCFHRVIPIFLRRCPPSPTVYYANIIFRRGGRGNSSNERNGQWPRRRLAS